MKIPNFHMKFGRRFCPKSVIPEINKVILKDICVSEQNDF